MPKQAISITLDAGNVTWLKGRAGAIGVRSVSELLDRIVTAARASGRVGPARSVIGTIDVDATDALLDNADADVRAMFDASARRPMAVRETPPAHGARRPRTRKRRG